MGEYMKNISNIIEKINSIKTVILKEININYGYENRIQIEVINPADYIKWDYFNYKVNRLIKGIRIAIRYPNITYIFSKDEKLEEQLHEFEKALDKKYYLIEQPVVENLTIIAKITNCCNIDCQYCYDKPFRDKLGHNGILEIEAIDKMIDLASKYAEKIVIIWHGGEPTLAGTEYYRKIYDEILPKYPYVEFEISIQTNGTLLNKEWFELSKKYNMSIGSSYNATSEELRHTKEDNKLGSRENNINKVLDNIYLAKDSNVAIGVIDVLTKKNHSRIKEIYQYYKKIGINACFNEIFNAGEAVNHDFIFITPEEQEAYLKTNVEYFKHWLTDQQGCFNDRFAHKYITMLLSGQCDVCEHSNACVRHYIGINSNGDIYPCDRPLPSKYRMGNIYDFNNFYEIYETDEYATFETERNTKLEDNCYQCDIFDYCKGGCPLIDIDVFNNAAIPNGYACKIRHLNLSAAYEALKQVTFDELNPIMKDYLIKKNGVLPREIDKLTKELNLDGQIKELLSSDNGNSVFLSEDFKLFQILNPPRPEDYIFSFDKCECACDLKAIELEDRRLDNIKEAMKLISENYQVKLEKK